MGALIRFALASCVIAKTRSKQSLFSLPTDYQELSGIFGLRQLNVDCGFRESIMFVKKMNGFCYKLARRCTLPLVVRSCF